MANNIEKLLALQEIDARVLQYQREIKELPLRMEEIDQRSRDQKQALEDAKAHQMTTQARIKEYEVEAETKKELINKYRRQQMEVKDNEAYRALETEIRETERRIRDIEDHELDFMEKLEACQAQVAEAEQSMVKNLEHIDEEKAELQQRLDKLTERMKKLEEKRAATAADIDRQWLAQYERILSNKKDQALANAANGSCSACHMRLPPQQIHDAKRTDTLTPCHYCGRLLYFRV